MPDFWPIQLETGALPNVPFPPITLVFICLPTSRKLLILLVGIPSIMEFKSCLSGSFCDFLNNCYVRRWLKTTDFGKLCRTWFSFPWQFEGHSHHILFSELFSVVAAIFTWSHCLSNKQIIIYTDNLAIAHGVVNSTYLLVQSLFLFTAKLNINIIM